MTIVNWISFLEERAILEQCMLPKLPTEKTVTKQLFLILRVVISNNISTRISDTNRILLCCLIAREIDIYLQLILKAWNLLANQKYDSLSGILNQCLIKPSENNVLEYPFSWKAFQLGATCLKSLRWLASSEVQAEELATFGFDNSTMPLLYNSSSFHRSNNRNTNNIGQGDIAIDKPPPFQHQYQLH
jgi:hypothetical protein